MAMNNATREGYDSLLKKGIWIYVLLLIFEGAFRKWFLPALSTPFLFARDPVAIWLIITSWRKGLFPANLYVFFMVFIGIVGIYTAVFLGHGNLFVAMYGARILVFHFPLLFVIGRIFARNDILKVGKFLLWVSILMTLVIALQFYNPQSAWINRGVGGDMLGSGFGAVGDYFRPSGTFSFTNGISLFYGLLASFVFYFWIGSKEVNRFLLIGATIALIISIPLSISRGLFFQIGVTLIFATLAISRKPKYFGRLLLAVIGGMLAITFLSKTSFFQTAAEVFALRFDSANEQEGGLEGVLGDRYLGGLIGALSTSYGQPFFGYGLGMGTNVGSMIFSGKRMFLMGEGEWGRIIGELGPLLGLAVIFVRISVCATIAFASYRKLVTGDLLPWMLLSFGLLTVPQAQWSQPTSLGFCTLIGGLMIASMREQEPLPKQAG
jgi:hypothetical protein